MKKKILVTGGSGFLGKRVLSRLSQTDWTVSAPKHSDYDLTEQSAIRKMLREYTPDLIIHLAALVGGIGANKENPGKYFYNNLVMGVMLMEEARLSNVKKFVSVGTICSYPKHAKVPFKEDEIWFGYPEETNAPYGLAKKMLLVQSQAYRKQYGFNAIHLMPVNLYGPDDNFSEATSHVIPAMIRKFVEAKEKGASQVVLWGDGSATREFLYVDDAASAIIMAAEKYNDELAINLGSGKEISIFDLAHLVSSVVGYSGEINWDSSKPNGQPRRNVDTSRAKEYLGFEAKTDLKSGLEETVRSYLARTKQTCEA